MFARPFRLGLERLDDRNAPSSLVGNDVATADWMSATVSDSLPDYSVGNYGDPSHDPNRIPANNLKPEITNFLVTVENSVTGRFSGKVVDENPAGLNVTLTGPQGCLNGGQTVTTDAEGNFVFVGQLVTGVDCGVVNADAADAQGSPADRAEYDLTV
jgi:hypothetical protein